MAAERIAIGRILFSFQFHQTGAYFIKDGRMYRIPRRFQTLQARKAGIDYKIIDGYLPDIASE